MALSDAEMLEIAGIKRIQEELYSNPDRFTVQVILTFMHNSPMTVGEVLELQKRIKPTTTEGQVRGLLNELTSMGYATKIDDNTYEHTEKSGQVLSEEGVTKDLLFPNP